MNDPIVGPKQLFALNTTGTSYHILELLEGGRRTFCAASSDMDSNFSRVYSPSPGWQACLDDLFDKIPFLIKYIPFLEPSVGALSLEEMEEFNQWKDQVQRRSNFEDPKSALVAEASHDRGHFTKEFAWIKAQGELSVFHARILAWFALGMLEDDCKYLYLDFSGIQPSQAALLFLDLLEPELFRFPTKVLYVSPQQLGTRDVRKVRWVTSTARAQELGRKWWSYSIPSELVSAVG